MVVLSVVLVNVMRGGKKPLFVELTSNFAEASGVVVPIPVCAFNKLNIKVAKNSIISFFILYFFNTLNK